MKDINKVILREHNSIICKNKEEYISSTKQAMIVHYLKEKGYYITSGLELLTEDFIEIFEKTLDTVKAEPFYKNFPQEVWGKSELELHLDQITHYFTTYGIEYIFNVEVKKGWLPEGESVKVTNVENLVPLKPLSIHTEESYIDFLANQLKSNTRSSEQELEIYSEHAKSLLKKVDSVGFKENLTAIFKEYITDLEPKVQHSIYGLDGELTLNMKLFNVKDLLTIISSLVDEKYKFRTNQRKFLCELLDFYDLDSFLSNVSDNQSLSKKALNSISYNSLGKNDITSLYDGSLKSYMSTVEESFANKSLNETLKLLSQRQGILFRSINRLMKHYNITNDEIKSILDTIDIDKISVFSIIQTINSINNTNSIKEDKDNEESKFHPYLSNAVHSLLKSKIKMLSNKLDEDNILKKAQKIYVDNEGFDLSKSYFAPISDEDESSFLKQGLAFDVSKYDNLRLFTYWNDISRIDIDIHAIFKGGTVGWNGYKKHNGMTYSGDITHSDAAEYIDLNLKDKEIPNKVQLLGRIYSGARSFKDIETSYIGIMVTPKETQDTTNKLYSSKNVIFKNELNGSTGAFTGYIYDNGVIRYGDKYTDVNFSVKDILDMIFKYSNIIVVENADDSDIVIKVSELQKNNYLLDYCV